MTAHSTRHTAHRKSYYPLFADLRGLRCVVVGGGSVAQRKVTRLLGCGASVTVVSPRATRRLLAYARRGTIRHVKRMFRASDLAGAWLVYGATDDERINALVSRAAAVRRIFANIVDRTPLCSFIAPAIFTRGALTIAVSTAGASPTIAKKVRTDLGRLVSAEYVPLLQLLERLRPVAKIRLPAYEDRKRYFEAIVRGRVAALIRAGKRPQARREALRVLAQHAARHNGYR